MVTTKTVPILLRYTPHDLGLFTIRLYTYGTYTHTLTEMNPHICCLITNMHAQVMKFDR